MGRIFVFLGKNTVPTIVITIITLVVFATSVYGFVKITDLNTPIEDIPEVETIEQKITENISQIPAESPEYLGSSDITIEQNNLISPAPTIAPVVSQQDNPASLSPTTVPIVNQQSNPGQNQETAQNVQTQQSAIGNNSQIEIDDDIEDVHEDDEERDNNDDEDDDHDEEDD